jgi:AraC family transcriptional regulator, regulatory protein of adaptative response / methylated-DNA-[protein]-cysteine methyltransferase
VRNLDNLLSGVNTSTAWPIKATDGQWARTCRKLTGRAPTEAANVILIHRFTTLLGPMFVCATEHGVCLLEFVGRRMLETEFKDLQQLLRARILTGENAHTRQAEREIGEYFAGTHKRFDLTLDTPGSPFQLSVWQALQAVPYGSTASYGEQAEKLGNPQSVRAVAGANGTNRVAIVVPCHRVMRKDGALSGYGDGLARKQWLLEHEKRHAWRTPLNFPSINGLSHDLSIPL